MNYFPQEVSTRKPFSLMDAWLIRKLKTLTPRERLDLARELERAAKEIKAWMDRPPLPCPLNDPQRLQRPPGLWGN